MILYDIAYSTLANKCPRCHKGSIFTSGNPYKLKSVLKMNEECSYCGLKYEREPGFFYGAMYVSYGMMSGIFIVWYTIDQLWLHLPALVLFLLVVASLLLFFPVAFRWARIIWLNFLSGMRKGFRNKKILKIADFFNYIQLLKTHNNYGTTHPPEIKRAYGLQVAPPDSSGTRRTEYADLYPALMHHSRVVPESAGLRVTQAIPTGTLTTH